MAAIAQTFAIIMGITADPAFGHYLAQPDYRHPMIEWAMDRVAGGSECPATTRLADADYEADDEVVRLFRRPAEEVNIHLPDKDGEREYPEPWIAARLSQAESSLSLDSLRSTNFG